MFKKIKLPMLAAIVGLVLAFANTAFTKPHKAHPNKSLSTVYYQFNLDQVSGDRSANNYTSISDPSSPGCSGTGVVCVVSYNSSTYSSLQAYLNTFSSDAAVVSAAYEQKM